jgi:hypothetical protein
VAQPSLEAVVLYLDADGIHHVSPRGSETVRTRWDPDLDPAESIVDAVAGLGVSPVMVHSTSWRVVDREIVLTFLVAIDAPGSSLDACDAELVTRTELARGRAIGAPVAIHVTQVVEHGLRHLAWLVREDPGIRAALVPWVDALAVYEPEPFRSFGPTG